MTDTNAAPATNANMEALLSAIARLPTPVFAFTGNGELRPLNRSAIELAELEGLSRYLRHRTTPHPLTSILQNTLDAPGTSSEMHAEFPSGRRYAIEASMRSDKGSGRWLLVLIRHAGTRNPDAIRQIAAGLGLTPREIEIVILMVAGRSSTELCTELSIARNTLKSHLASLFSKTGCHNRTQLVARFFEP
ncbi:MAG: LuxR C-terminal-related transcriptional regulator [Thermoanaerobaculia bacterium]